jgi:hypothetical protein
VDWNVRWDRGSYAVDGYLAGALASGDRVMRDGSSGRGGGAGRLLFSRIAAEHWLYGAAFDFSTRFFNPNDLGFFAQPHDYGGYTQLLYRENFGTGIFRRYALGLVPEFRWNWAGILTSAQLEFSATGDFVNFWRASLTYDLRPPAYDDEERGIIGLYRRPWAHALQAQVRTDESRNVSVTATGMFGFDAKRKTDLLGSLALTVRPVSWVEVTPTVLWLRTRNEEAWVFPGGNVVDLPVLPEAFSVFAERDVDELDCGLRGIVTFTRTLSLQFYTQILLARGGYQNFRRFEGDQAIAYDFRSSPSFTNADFNEALLNANVLLRWEYLPGSALFLVWTQGRAGDTGNFTTDFGRRLSDVFALPHEDALLLKVSYWLPL